MDKYNLLVIILQMSIGCTEVVQYSISICGFTLVERENPRDEWLLLSCVSVSHRAICNTYTQTDAGLSRTFSNAKEFEENVKSRKGYFNC